MFLILCTYFKKECRLNCFLNQKSRLFSFLKQKIVTNKKFGRKKSEFVVSELLFIYIINKIVKSIHNHTLTIGNYAVHKKIWSKIQPKFHNLIQKVYVTIYLKTFRKIKNHARFLKKLQCRNCEKKKSARHIRKYYVHHKIYKWGNRLKSLSLINKETWTPSILNFSKLTLFTCLAT